MTGFGSFPVNGITKFNWAGSGLFSENIICIALLTAGGVGGVVVSSPSCCALALQPSFFLRQAKGANKRTSRGSILILFIRKVEHETYWKDRNDFSNDVTPEHRDACDGKCGPNSDEQELPEAEKSDRRWHCA